MHPRPDRCGVGPDADRGAARSATADDPSFRVPPPGTLVTLESGVGVAVPAIVHGADTERLTLELLATGLPATVAPGSIVAADARHGESTLRWRGAIASVAAFPVVEIAVHDVETRTGEPPGPQIALAFPARYEVVAGAAATIAARVRARLDCPTETGRAGVEPAEVALLALAKMMARLDARFDRVLARGAELRDGAPADAGAADDPHAVLVFSLAKMMLTRLDEKFDRLLAAMRDPAVLSRPPIEIDDAGGGLGVPSPQVLVLHALTRLMESLSEKFERVVAVVDGRGEASCFEDAWALAIGEAGVVLGLPTPVDVGALLDLELRLPLFPAVPLLVFGRVDAVSDQGDDSPERRYRTAVTFVALPEADRELIVQLVMRKQREQLRARHGHPDLT